MVTANGKINVSYIRHDIANMKLNYNMYKYMNIERFLLQSAIFNNSNLPNVYKCGLNTLECTIKYDSGKQDFSAPAEFFYFHKN